MASQASRKHASAAPVIPDRLYFKIGDVARICGLDAYVLRFWESQFPQLKPNKSGAGQRLYRRRDVELVLDIQRLVHKEGYTIPGARHVLETGPRRPSESRPAPPSRQSEPPADLQFPAAARAADVKNAIAHARAELREIANLLAGSQPPARQPAASKPAAAHSRPKIVKPRPGSDNLFPL